MSAARRGWLPPLKDGRCSTSTAASRGFFPHVRSVMMDQQTLDDHAAYVVEGNRVRVDRFDGLTEAELPVAQHVLEHNLRMEQEHIPHEYALIQLGQMLGSGGN